MSVVTELCIYPYKSSPVVRVQTAEAGERGFASDRRFMVVDAQGTFMTQRSHPVLGRTQVTVTATGFDVQTEELGKLQVNAPAAGEEIAVREWGGDFDVWRTTAEADDWFSQLVGQPARLVFMPDSADRTTKGRQEVSVSFADGAPYLVASEDSLADLNERHGGQKVPMAAFRPNLVVKGFAPWAEDRWTRLIVGDAVFELISECERCSMTTLDPRLPTKPRRDGQPLRELNAFRRNDRGKVTFGYNAVCTTPGRAVSVGQIAVAE